MPIEEKNKDLSNTEHMLLDRYFSMVIFLYVLALGQIDQLQVLT